MHRSVKRVGWAYILIMIALAGNTALFLKKCRSNGEPLATLFPISSSRGLNLKLPDPETNALALDQLVGRLSKLCMQSYTQRLEFVYVS